MSDQKRVKIRYMASTSCGGCLVARGLTSIGVREALKRYVSTVVSTMIN
jgi:hypothetical protein